MTYKTHSSALGLCLVLAALALPAVPLSATAQEEAGAFESILEPYRAIQHALYKDSVDGVAEESKALAKRVRSLAENPAAAAAGVPTEKLGEFKQEILPKLIAAATQLEGAEGLAAVREAFYALSKPLVRYRTLLPEPDVEVAYCEMAEKAWLQPDGEIENPYHGQSMAACGEFVSKE